MQKEIKLFITALMLFTRIPFPNNFKHNPIYFRESIRYFSFIGWIVGSFGALIFLLSNYFFSKDLAVVFSMIATIIITGAFHEDGWADVCDGFGGGWTKEKIVQIMKDSRLGTFGVVGLIAILSLKFLLTKSFPNGWVPFMILSGHVVSRTIASRTLLRKNNIESEIPSKFSIETSNISLFSFVVNFLIGCTPFFLVKNWIYLSCLGPLFLLEFCLFRYFKKWINGYTGDCLGSIQQLSEITFYICMLLLCKFI